MKYLKQILIILAFSFMGEILHEVLIFPIPASVYGLVLLFLALVFRLLKVSDLGESAEFLLKNMPVFFIPAAVGLLEYWGTLRKVWLPFCVITVVSTFVVFAVSGWITQALVCRKRENGNGGTSHE